MVLPVSIIILVVIFYSLVMFMLLLGMGRLKNDAVSSLEKPAQVTVVIPFRDEEERLSDLIKDLKSQTYPKDSFTVILVNDHSRDASEALMNSLIGSDSRFLYLSLPDGRSGKKEALFYGIQQAKSDWIIQTDADCRLGPQFIFSHMAFREKRQADMVAGLVTTRQGTGGFMEAFERLDLLSLVGSGAGSFYFKRPIMCNGANLAYSRELYQETRKLDPSGGITSGDDMFLMIGARKLGKKLSFMVSREAMVETIPIGSIGEFIAQRIRWGSKAVFYGMIDIQLLALLVAFTNILVLLIPLFIFLNPEYWFLLMGVFVVKSMSDFSILYRITGFTGQRKSLRMFIPISLTYHVSQLVILTGSLLTRPSWKGRRVSMNRNN